MRIDRGCASESIAHPNVVVVHEVGTHGAQVYIAMERVRGKTLREWLAAGHTRDEVPRVLLDAGHGLAAAHAAQLIHRDFKPDNVLISDDGRARVTDFGLARLDRSALPDDPRLRRYATSPMRREGPCQRRDVRDLPP